LAALEDPGADLRVLEGMIARDLGLSYRLLRYINSAFFGLRQQVRSIGHALAMLGLENRKQWAALSVFASVEGKPAELTITALIRARFCQLASPPNAASGELFTLGLFSVIDG
jgi:c-di-GMP phosphodiesterase